MRKINYYISSHGFGHSTRAIEVINHIPEFVDVEIVTRAPQWLFDVSIRRPFRFRPLHHDPGIVQFDSLRSDLEKTYKCWESLLKDYPRMAEEEARRITDEQVGLAVGDVSPFAAAAASQAGIPSAIVANFSWDWIFSAFVDQKSEFQTVIEAISAYYRRVDLLLRTPLAGDLSIFSTVQDVPMIVRRSNQSRLEARRQFGLKPEDHIVLISFGGMGLANIEPDFLEPFRDIIFLTFDPKLQGPSNVRYLPSRETYHPDAIQAADLALAKLGYGVVTECIAHQTPIAYPPRKDFLEHFVLEREAARWIPAIPIDENDFFQGRWDFLEDFFDRIRAPKQTTGPDRLSMEGGEAAARELVRLMTDS
ncbi:MAG: hypothetical protein JXR73_11005 [Candidatus Omnitrophica bacterium]|nr:hypothetical protein [Candidatus Omnitrophota bacterium]